MPAAPAPGTPTLRALLRRRELRLQLTIDEADLEPGALDRPMRWVHSSDLADPTPFLSEGLALLTTGTQFTDHPDPEPYVARLKARGVLGLGYGTEVARDGIPTELADACRAHRMPLFEVPYGTPFIAVARANAEAVAAESHSRRSWALAAQRAVALAALRSGGLDEILAELSRRLDAWVGLFDTTGTATHRHPIPLDPAVAAELAAEVETVLRREGASGASLRLGGVPFTLQTLGRTGHLRGVLVVGKAELDQEARGVVTAVVAMAELAFTQGERLGAALARLRTALLRLLLAGDAAVVAAVSRELWGALPVEPVEVMVTDASGDAVAAFLERRAGRGVFFARDGAVIVAATAAGGELADELVARFDASAGVSTSGSWADMPRLRAEAGEALRTGAGDGVSRFAVVAAAGVLTGIDSAAARLRAEAVLAPLRAEGGPLEETLVAWLQNDARYDTTAEALGVHRHTVRARIAQAGRLLGVDLGAFPARADVWVALQLAGR
ncbi:MAG: PucR family transcriptional regulator [Microbacterium sp.]|uniref:PucR family transcriptional regulator n=1 Tax=Microbacterium sp. TaxID=51671 RepID=UPI003A8C44FA